MHITSDIEQTITCQHSHYNDWFVNINFFNIKPAKCSTKIGLHCNSMGVLLLKYSWTVFRQSRCQHFRCKMSILDWLAENNIVNSY